MDKKELKEKLKIFGLIDENNKPTKDALHVSKLSVNINESKMLIHAKEKELLPFFVIIIAIIQVGGIRSNQSKSHDWYPDSDILDAYLAFAAMYAGATKKAYNIEYKKYKKALHKSKEMCKILNIEWAEPQYSSIIISKLSECIAVGSIFDLYSSDRRRKLYYLSFEKEERKRFSISKESIVSAKHCHIATGHLTSSNQNKLLNGVTSFKENELKVLADVYPNIVQEELSSDEKTFIVFGRKIYLNSNNNKKRKAS